MQSYKSPRLPPHANPPIGPLHPYNCRPALLVASREERRPGHALYPLQLLRKQHRCRKFRRAYGTSVSSEACWTPFWASGRLPVAAVVADVVVEHTLGGYEEPEVQICEIREWV